MKMNIVKAIVALVIITVLGYFAGTLSERPKPPVVISHGEADIGGPFELVNTQGATVTEQALLGTYSLVYFGYTNCPDVCPLDMNRMSMALDILEETGNIENLQPIFISVDPARDTPEVIAEFLSHYHPLFIGLTGTQEQMEKAAKAYKVYYEEMLMEEHEEEHVSFQQKPEWFRAVGLIQIHNSDPALINHTAYIYLMGPDGIYIKHFGADVTPTALAESLRDFIDQP